MKIKSKKMTAKVAALVLSASLAVTPMLGSFTVFAANNGQAVPAYKTQAEAEAAARELNEKLTAEGSVLLKNKNNALPLSTKDSGDVKADISAVTVFGSAATSLQGGTGKVDTTLKDAGFTVNSKVVTETNVAATVAAADATAEQKEAAAAAKTALDGDLQGYTKVGVVVLKRGGGEGSDLSVATNEAADDATENNGWTHKRLAIKNDKEVKHNQMLTANEINMINYAKEACDKVVVILNTSNAMEMYNLEHDDAIDSILWIGRPGANGIKALPKLLTGEYNPSGKLVAEWYKDFTADPTWYNSIGNTQNDAGSDSYILEDGKTASNITLHGVDYSEDIYMGYKYYETVYAEIAAGRLQYTDGVLSNGAGTQAQAEQWHADNVVYPFGYGLSYANFEMEIVGTSETELDAKDISSSIGSPAKVKTVTVSVEVTNNASVAGKEVVEIYSSAPYTVGGIEKASVNLVGYTKTKNLKPGESQIVTVEVNLQDMASYDYTDANSNNFKGYELEKGTYTLYASNTSHCTDETASVEIEVKGDGKYGKGATLQLDDYTDNVIENLFSKENGRYYSLRKNDADWNGDGVVDAKDKMFTKEQQLLSRADLVGTFPEAPVTMIETSATETISVASIKEFSTTATYAVGEVVKVTTSSTGVTGSTSVSYYVYTKAHAAGAFDASECTALSGEYIGGLVVTQAFADLMNYYAGYTLNTWTTEYAYFATASGAKAGSTVGISGTKKLYKVGATDIAGIPSATVGAGYAANDYVALGNDVYKIKTAIDAITVKTNSGNNGKASADYAIGDVVTYQVRSGRTTTTYTVQVTAAIANGADFVNSGSSANCKTFTAAERLTTDNSTKMTVEEYLVAFGAELLKEENSGHYVYSDKLFQGTAGINGYLGNEDGLYDVTADMMEGWSQMANAAAQEEAISSGDWIYFNELNGIKFNDKTVITEGKFSGMTGEEVWLKFMNQWTWEDFCTACWTDGNNGRYVSNLGIPEGGIQDSPTSFHGTYTWCDNCSIASTWNIELGEKQGRIAASLGLFKNTSKNETTSRADQWLNPAINFQRTPFSGRNNEYYAQDGYQAGWYAQAVVKGIQSTGVGSHLKHMFLNDQETNRNQGDLFAWLSEQAIREIYAKAFQMAIQEGGAEGAMSAFARIGAVPTPVNEHMCNLLVRKEWGATNFMFHPDMYSPQANVAPEDLMLRTGHNHAPGGSNASNTGSAANNTYAGRWDAEYENPLTGGLGGVYIGKNDEATGQEVYYSNNQWYIVRYSAMIMYSEYANDSHSQNGILKFQNDYKGYEVSATVGKAIALDASYKAGEANAQTVEYSLSGNRNPAGISINAKTGLITGKIAEAGEYTVTVQALFDHWITVSATYTISVSDAAGESTTPGTGLTEAQVQEMIDAALADFTPSEGGMTEAEVNKLISDAITEAFKDLDTDGATQAMVDAAVKKALEGITSGMTEDEVKAIVAEAVKDINSGLTEEQIGKLISDAIRDAFADLDADGVTEAMVKAIVDKALEGKVDLTITKVESVTGGFKITFSNGTDYTIVNGTNGTNGANGADGAQGPAGPAGADGSGCGSAIGSTVGIVSAAMALVMAAVVVAKKRRNADE